LPTEPRLPIGARCQLVRTTIVPIAQLHVDNSDGSLRKRRRAPIAAAISGGSGGLPPTRPAEPHPTGRPRVCG